MDTGAFLHTVAGVEIFGRKISEYTAQEHSTWLVCFGREIPRCCRCGYFWLGNLRVYGTGVFNVGGFFWQGNPLIYGQVWYMYSIYCRKFPKMYRHLGVWSSKSSRPLFSGTCLCACMFIACASACIFIACVPACVSPAQVPACLSPVCLHVYRLRKCLSCIMSRVLMHVCVMSGGLFAAGLCNVCSSTLLWMTSFVLFVHVVWWVAVLSVADPHHHRGQQCLAHQYYTLHPSCFYPLLTIPELLDTRHRQMVFGYNQDDLHASGCAPSSRMPSYF